MGDPIEFAAQVYKVQTLVDNGIRVVFDLSENETLTMARLAECQRFGARLRIVANIEPTEDAPKIGGRLK